jgi:signal transduction histidine kinase
MEGPEGRGADRPARFQAASYLMLRWTIEVVFAAVFVIGVYEAVVAGGIALWPTAGDNWILPMWIAAATVTGLGLPGVRALAGALARRLWPSAAEDPYAALASFVTGAAATGPAEEALPRLARLAASGTGARSAAVWLAQPEGGLRLGARWPDGADAPAGADAVPDLRTLTRLAGAAHLVAVRDADELLGALILTATAGRRLTPGDRRLAADVANAAGPLLRNAELTSRLADEVRRHSEQAVELDRSRLRVVAARDAAREQLGREIQARVGAPLERSAEQAAALQDEDLEAAPDAESSLVQTAIAEMTARIDTAIGDFRGIVHGVYPAVLTDHGLSAALGNLMADLPRRTTFTARDLPRLGARFEAGVYFCVAALLGSLNETSETGETGGKGGDQPVRLDAEAVGEGGDAALTLVLCDEAWLSPMRPGVLEAVRDRVAALDGGLELEVGEGGLRCVLTVPIGSDDLVSSTTEVVSA